MTDNLPAGRPLSDAPAESVRGDVMPRTTIEIRESARGWRVYQEAGHEYSNKYSNRVLTERGRILGGTKEQPIVDAEHVARENGFFFKRPSGLLPP